MSEIQNSIKQHFNSLFVFLVLAFLFVPGVLANSISRGLVSVHHLWRDFFLWSGAVVLAVALLVMGGFKAFRLSTRSVIFPLFLTLSVFEIFSAMQAPLPHLALMPIVRNLSLYIWATAALMFWQSEAIKTHLKLIVLTSVVVSVTSFLVFFYQHSQLINQPLFDFVSFKSASLAAGMKYPFFNPNIMGAFLMPLTLGLLVAKRCAWFNIPWSVIVACGITVFLTRSMAAILVLLLISGAIFLFSWFGLRRSFYFTVGFSITVFLFLFKNLNYESFVYDKSAGTRLLMWSAAWHAVFDEETKLTVPGSNPLTQKLNSGLNRPNWKNTFMGFGLGSYPAFSSLIRQKEYYAHVNAASINHHPHSSLFSYLFDTGVAGVFLGVTLFLALLVILLRHYRLPGREGQIAKVLLAVALALALHSFLSVAPHYFEHRLLWLLVFAGAIHLELRTKNHRYADQPRWPAEFLGPAHGIWVLVIILLCFKGAVVTTERLQGVYSYARISPNMGLQNIDDALKPLEESLFVNSKKKQVPWVDAQSIAWMKKCLLQRNNASIDMQKRLDNPSLARQFQITTLSQAEEIWATSPHYFDSSRHYANLLWDVYKNEVPARKVAGQVMDRVTIRNWSLALFQHHIRKGNTDMAVFERMVSDQELMSYLKKIFEKHPVHTEFFASRVDTKNMRLPLLRYWVHRYKNSVPQREKVLATIDLMCRRIPSGKERVNFVSEFGPIYFFPDAENNIDLKDSLWDLIEGVSTSNVSFRGEMADQLECLRLRLVKGEEVALQALEKLQKMGKYPDLLEALKTFIIKGPKIDKNR